MSDQPATKDNRLSEWAIRSLAQVAVGTASVSHVVVDPRPARVWLESPLLGLLGRGWCTPREWFDAVANETKTCSGYDA